MVLSEPGIPERSGAMKMGRFAAQALCGTLSDPSGGVPLFAGAPVGTEEFFALRRRAVLEGCKWDPQVGDVSTLANFPLIMRATDWKELANLAEQLTVETLAAERETLSRPELLHELGFPRALRRTLADDAPLAPAAVRVMRFDFHWTTDGWKVSEVNSDVPGGFTESSWFTSLMAEHSQAGRPAGNPVMLLADALAKGVGAGGIVGLLSAPGYMEDQQIMAFVADRLRERGLRPHLANPTQLIWRDGCAHLETTWFSGRLDAVFRFYQSEWLAYLPRRYGWENFFRGGRTAICNPGQAAIPESKRFPLIWDQLTTPLKTWREYLPESCDPRVVNWQTDDGWLVKSAMSNTGDTVRIRSLMPEHEWRRVRWEVRWESRRWVAQRRFESLAIATPDGPMHPCIGVYTIDGRAAGAYARISSRPLIDYAAVDAALLVTDEH
jgi:glutathionylspermidine synthase